jgi:exodeoxyribonuclease VII small subunit
MSRAQHHKPHPVSDSGAPSFEESLAELEGIVDALERGDLPLEASLAAFERGVGLSRACQKALDQAEQRVRILAESRADAEPQPFAADPTAR